MYNKIKKLGLLHINNNKIDYLKIKNSTQVVEGSLKKYKDLMKQ